MSRMLLLAGTMVAAAALLAHPAAAASPAPALLSLRAASAFDQVYVTSTGERVRIAVSDQLEPNHEENQAWAEFLASLPHGAELAEVVIYFAPVAEVQLICGRRAVACYLPTRLRVVVPAEEVPGQPPRQAVLAHEYGHHVANRRANPPWLGVSHGPKRWASHANICAGLRSGTYSMRQYELDPAEGFAEAYRVLAERTLGLEPTPWQLVDRLFEPDDRALTAILRDAVDPWVRNTVVQRRASRTTTYRFATPLDGTATVTLRGPRTAVYELRVPGAPPLRARGQGPARVSTTVCGSRRLPVTVRLVSGRGPYQLTVSRP